MLVTKNLHKVKNIFLKIESNIRRHGEVGGSAKKTGLRIKELERLYEIQNGSTHFQGNQYSKVVTNNSEAPKTQEQLAKDMGMSVDTLNNYKIRLERIESLKAEKNRFANLKQNIDSQNSDYRGRTDDIVSEKLGIGSRDTYRKEKYIIEKIITRFT